FVALSRGLAGRKGPRGYAVKHFGEIAHPALKLSWAVMLFSAGDSSPEILSFLRKALETKPQAETISAMLGPEFEEFKERVKRAHDSRGKPRSKKKSGTSSPAGQGGAIEESWSLSRMPQVNAGIPKQDTGDRGRLRIWRYARGLPLQRGMRKY